MSTKAQELRAQMMSVWERMKAINDQAEAEGRDLTDEERGNWKAAQDDYMGLTERVKRQEYLESTPLDDEERRVWDIHRDEGAGPPASPEEAAARAARAYTQAFMEYIRVPNPRMLSSEVYQTLYSRQIPLSDAEKANMKAVLPSHLYQAAMGTNTGAGGGFWVPDEMMQPV